MIQSMTGYGKALAVYEGKKIYAEIKSLNNKALDLSTRIAAVYREKDLEIRSIIAKELERGKVEFSLWIEQATDANTVNINEALVGTYYRQIKDICASEHIPEPADWWSTLLKMPDVMAHTEEQELQEEEWEAAKKAINEAIRQLKDFRIQEGAALEHKFNEKLGNIANLLVQIEPYEKQRTEKIRQRLTDALQNIPEVDYDRNRLEQEMIYYIEKLDINEEKQRLTNHLKYFRETMENGHGQGKKLGFIAQEMGREINTTGSKSNQAEMQNIVVKMKDELEQIKEQVLNVM